MKTENLTIANCVSSMNEIIIKSIKDSVRKNMDDFISSPESVDTVAEILKLLDNIDGVMFDYARILDARDYEINRKLNEISKELKELKELESKKVKADKRFSNN